MRVAYKVKLASDRSTAFLLRRLNSLGYKPSFAARVTSSICETFGINLVWVNVNCKNKLCSFMPVFDTEAQPMSIDEFLKHAKDA